MKKIIVTGGHGFIGSTLIKELLKKSSVRIELNTDIRSIEINDIDKIINLKSTKQSFTCSKLVLSHGSRLPKIK